MDLLAAIFFNKQTIIGMGSTGLALIIDMEPIAKIVVTFGTVLIIIFNILKAYEQAQTARIKKIQAKHHLEFEDDVLKENKEDLINKNLKK